MVINTNMSSINVVNNLAKAEGSMNRAIEKLSSGLRINRAGDDAAGLAIAQKMKTQTRGLEVAKRNCQDGISLVQTAEGAMVEIQDMLQRLKELTIQGVNGIYTSSDTDNLQAEVDQLIEQIGDIADKSDFNGINLLDGNSSISLQIGVNEDDSISIDAIDATLTKLDIDGMKVNQADSLAKLDEAINHISTTRATLGAVQNRLEHTMNSIVNTHENLSAAQSRIMDADMAKEMAEYTKFQVLVQAGVSIASQANQKTSMINQLLQ